MMKELIDILTNPLIVKTIVFYWIFSSFVGALPSPAVVSDKIKSGGWLLLYQTMFGFLHGVSGNLSRAAIAFKLPGASEDSKGQ